MSCMFNSFKFSFRRKKHVISNPNKLCCIAPQQSFDKEPKDDDVFTDIQIKDLREAFDLFDKDGDGFINTEELYTVMHSLRQNASQEQIQEMINQVDIDGNNLVDFDEFVLMMNQRQETPSEDSEMRAYFRVLDKDGNGYIDAQELKHTMHELGLPLTDKDLQYMMKEAKCDMNGRIYYEDFVRIMTGEIGKCQKRMSKLSVPSDGCLPDGNSTIENVGEYRDLQVAFAMFDKDGDGSITTQELREVMKSLNIDINKRDVKRLIKKIDKDGNGRVEFNEFRSALAAQQLLPSSLTQRQILNTQEEEMRQTFKIFDKHNRGYIDGQNLKETMKQLGVELNQGDIKAMLKTAGVTDGKIFYEDFVKIMFGQIVKPIPKDGAISDEQMQEMKVAFALFDHDGDGSVTPSELRTVMRHLGYSYDDQIVKQMINKFDHDGNGTLEYDEFAKMLTGLNKDGVTRWQDSGTKSPEPEAWRAFKVFDLDHNGYISPLELRSTMSELGINLSDEDVAVMMRLADTDGDGLINYEEFKKLMDGKFQGLLNCSAENGGDHVANGSVNTSDKKQGSSKTGNTKSQSTSKSKEGRHSGVSHSALNNSQRRMSRNSPPVPPRKNPPPPPPPREGHPRWHSMKEPNNSALNGGSSPMTDNSNIRRASDSKALFNSQSTSNGCAAYSESNVCYSSSSPKKQSKGSPLRRDSCGTRPSDFGGSQVSSFDATTSDLDPRESFGDMDSEMGDFIPLSPEYEQILRESFRLFDLNNDGFIQASELGLTMRKLGLSYTSDQLNCMVAKCDPAGNGIVDFEEFIRMMSRSRHRSKCNDSRKQCEEDEMRQAFKVFDIDGNGYIDENELKLTMQNLGEALSESDVKAMIKEADINGDGMIEYEEFIRMMYNKMT